MQMNTSANVCLTGSFGADTIANNVNKTTNVLDRYLLREELGDGAQAVVFAALDRCTGATVAVKRFTKRKQGNNDTAHAEYGPVDEYNLHSSLRHPNVVAALNCLATATHTYMVVELCNGADLFAHLDPSGPGIDEQSARALTGDIAMGLAYLHSEGVVHCDIKPENVLVHNGRAKICDFGCSGRAGELRNCRAVGTRAYMAPELLTAAATSHTLLPAHDAWGFGVLIYAVLFSDLPWESASEEDADWNSFVQAGGVSEKLYPFGMLSSGFCAQVAGLFSSDPNQRPSMASVAAFIASGESWFATPLPRRTIAADVGSTSRTTSTNNSIPAPKDAGLFGTIGAVASAFKSFWGVADASTTTTPAIAAAAAAAATTPTTAAANSNAAILAPALWPCIGPLAGCEVCLVQV
jgi:serine/threonine protein kinase